MTPPPGPPHRDAASQLNLYLTKAILKQGYKGRLYVPEAPIWTDEDTYLIPDLMYVSEKLRKQFKEGSWTKADLVVEIISPSNQVYDRTTKSDTYKALGVRELWLVDPSTRTVEVRSFETNQIFVYGPRETMRSVVLQGFSLRVSLIFK